MIRLTQLTIRAALIALIAGALIGLSGNVATAGGKWWKPNSRPTPDSQINATGAPFKGTNAKGEVRGFVDAHNHLMTNEAFGGRIICGKPFSQAGIADALQDCPEHQPNGMLALLEPLTGGDATHDPVGWPSFKYWPNRRSYTHQQNYYAWLERAWRGGERVLVNDLTSNRVLCQFWIAKDGRSCDEMDSIRLQAAKTYEMQAYIDQMYGGSGKGWFRIVKSAARATAVVKKGKLAVVLGVETSEPFGCGQVLDIPTCTKADIDKGLDELHALGVRSMFLCHKSDNALCGVRFDEGATGTLINTLQLAFTGTSWKTQKCTGPQQDHAIAVAPLPVLGPLLSALPLPLSLPIYDPDARCNTRGLTDLGEYALRGLMKRHMMLELDHMSVKAARSALGILESASYPGVISSHSWMDTDWTERLYKLGGFVAGYDSSSQAFVDEWKQKAALRKKYHVGYGFGSDMNGLGGWPAGRGTAVKNPVKYPFKSFDGGTTFQRLTTGTRTWDFNIDGAANVGLLPDWIEDLRQVGGKAIVRDLARGAQSYLDTWCATQDHGRGGVRTCR